MEPAEAQKYQSNNAGSFWHINIGHIGAMSLVILSAIALWFGLVGRVSLLEDHEKVVAQLIIRVELMDEHGTRASQRGIYEESSFSKGEAAKVAELQREHADDQKTFLEIMSIVKETQVNVQWMMRQTAGGLPANTHPAGNPP